jgi:hypothetical protein
LVPSAPTSFIVSAGSKKDPETVNTCVAVSATARLVGEILVIEGGVARAPHPDAVYDSMYPVVEL